MGRKTTQYKVASDNRDNGKVFLLTEMGAEQTEDWGIRVILGLISSNVQVPDGILELGMAGLVEMGFKSLSGLKWELAKPLMTELMACVQIIPDPKKPQVYRELVESDIEEATIRATLKWEVLKLHVDFSKAAEFSGLAEKALKAAKRK